MAMLQEAAGVEGVKCVAVGGEEEPESWAFQKAVPPTDGMDTAEAEEALEKNEEICDARAVERRSYALDERGQCQRASSSSGETVFPSGSPGQSSTALHSCLTEKISSVEEASILKEPSRSPRSPSESPRVCVSEFG